MKVEIQPDYRIVKVDYTSMCGETWRHEKGIKACGIYYLVDANLHVHICSLTPSLEAWPMNAYVEFENDDAWEKNDGEVEIELMSSEETCSYFGTRILSNPSERLRDYLTLSEREDDETDMQYRMRVAEECREYFAGNPAGF